MLKLILISTALLGALTLAQSDTKRPRHVLGFRGCVERCIQKCLDERRPAAKCKCGWCNVFRTQEEKGKYFDEEGNILP